MTREMDELIRVELDAIVQGVARLRALLLLQARNEAPPAARWNTDEGPKGSYEWIDAHKDPALKQRIVNGQGQLRDDAYYYWLGSQGDRIFRRSHGDR